MPGARCRPVSAALEAVLARLPLTGRQQARDRARIVPICREFSSEPIMEPRSSRAKAPCPSPTAVGSHGRRAATTTACPSSTCTAPSARRCAGRPRSTSSSPSSASATWRSAGRASGARTRAPGRRIADFPADVEHLADRLGLGRFAVVGVSAGGPYAHRLRPGPARPRDGDGRGQLALAALRAPRRALDARAHPPGTARARTPARPRRPQRRARHAAARAPPAGARPPRDARRHARRPPAAGRRRDGRRPRSSRSSRPRPAACRA